MSAGREAGGATVREVVPGVHQLLLGGRSAHSYVLRGQRSTVMIDSGLPSHWGAQEEALAQVGLAPADVNLVLLTHEHIDHAGGAPFFPKHTLIGAHRLAAGKLALRDEFALMNQAFELTLDEFHVDIMLAEGTEIDLGDFHLQVIPTPGHCSGAVCFLETKHGLLFSGDTVMAAGVIGGVLGSGNVSDYLDSVRRLAGYRAEAILPGHGRVSSDPAGDIERARTRLEALLAESKMLFDAVRHSPHSFDQITRSLRSLNLR